MPMTRRAIAVVIAVEALVAIVTAATIVDLRAHSARQTVRDVNMWGYRGLPRLRPVGLRVAVVGGSAAFGYGVDWEQSMPYYLGGDLDRLADRDRDRVAVDAINLAAVGGGAASYISTLETYAYLKPHTVCIYDGYSGLGISGADGGRRESTIFRATGYFPIVDDVLARREPRMAANLAAIDPLLRDDASGDVSCGGGSRPYCTAIEASVTWVLAHGMTVAVVIPPYISRRHELQQTSLVEMLTRRFGDDRRVGYINLGRAFDLHDPALSPDGVHLSALGNQNVALALTAPVYKVLRQR
jgi:hypothetical protein